VRRIPDVVTVLVVGLALTACAGAASSVAAAPSVVPTVASVASVPVSSAPPPLVRVGSLPLRGKVIVIDPGHNGGNASHPTQINRLVHIVTKWKACDTTGTATDHGYPEYAFTLDVAKRAARILRAEGATVVLTRSSSTGVGPCIDVRARIGNRAHADAAISIHADGGPAGGHGFHVIRPANVGPNAAIVAPSRALALYVRSAFRRGTGESYSTYVGRRALVTRNDLGGLNLSKVPKVFIECANMRNAADAQRLTDWRFRQRAAASIAAGLASFVRSRR